jgi:hypothetical protein
MPFPYTHTAPLTKKSDPVEGISERQRQEDAEASTTTTSMPPQRFANVGSTAAAIKNRKSALDSIE